MNVTDTYTITSTNTLLNNKLDISTYNAGIILKANIADVYNKSVFCYCAHINVSITLAQCNNNFLCCKL